MTAEPNPAYITLPVVTAEHVFCPPDESYIYPAEGCAYCDKPLNTGDPVVRMTEDWAHVACAQRAAGEMTTREQTLLLATLVSSSPSRFTAGMVRQAIRGLLALLGRHDLEAERRRVESVAAVQQLVDHAKTELDRVGQDRDYQRHQLGRLRHAISRYRATAEPSAVDALNALIITLRAEF
jgi:hypothetical protein